MLKLKSIRKKDAPNFCKWEAYTVNDDYVIIRYKDKCLDVRASRSMDEFLISGFRTLYRVYLENENANYIELEEVVDILGLEFV